MPFVSSSQKTMDTVYSPFWSQEYQELVAQLNHSQSPRSAATLYELVAEFGADEHARVLDIGCGWGTHTSGIALHLGCSVTGVDISEANLERARALTAQVAPDRSIAFQQGDILSLPFAPELYDMILCCDMVEYILNLPRALRECARVMKPEGTLFIQGTFATPLLEPDESASWCTRTRIPRQNLFPVSLEQALESVQLQVVRRMPIGGEWYEHELEQKAAPQPLLQLSRLRRKRAQLVAAYGEEVCDAHEWLTLCRIYHLLGKLVSTIYAVKKVGAR